MIGAIVHQLTRNLNDEQVREGGFAPYFVDHTTGVYPTAASGFPWNAASMAVKGDVICDLSEDMAAIIGPIIVEGIGEESYDAILTACGDGVKLKPAQCNLVMVQVFATVCQAIFDRLNDVKQSKAAHYLQDVVTDAQKPDDEKRDR